MSEHLSTLVLDRLLAGEREGLDDALAHLATCSLCQAALEQRRAERAQWRSTVDRSAFLAAVRARAAASETPTTEAAATETEAGEAAAPNGTAASPADLSHDDATESPLAPVISLASRRAAAGLAMVAAAAAAVLVVVPSDPAGPDGPDGPGSIGLKGGASLTVLRVTGGHSRPVGLDEILASGTRIGFAVRCPGGCTARLFAAEPAPTPLGAPLTVPADDKALLPFTAVLDDGPGRENIVAVFCNEPSALDHAAAMVSGEPPVSGCEVVRREIKHGE